MKKETGFDFESFREEALGRLKAGDPMLGKDGIFTPLLREFLEASLDGEMDAHLMDRDESNRRNGHGRKVVKTKLGPVGISTPRDRDGSFQPEVIAKRSNVLSSDIDEVVLLLYSQGSSYLDIREHLSVIYGLEASESTLTRITDKVWPLVQQWRSRCLDAVYPFIWMDAIHFKVRVDGRVVSRAVYCVIGANNEGYKSLLGMYFGESEGAKFWLHVLTDLQDRGVEDVFIASIDNLKGFAEAIEAVFPRAQVQLCIIHQIRNSLRFIPDRDMRAFMKDLKEVYRAETLERAELMLDKLDEKWGKVYPKVIESWRRNWARLSNYFQYPMPIRRVIYTTNIIEGFNRQLRKATKTKGAFTSEQALIKLLYLVQERITKKWEKPIFNWNSVLAQLSIIFDERLRLPL
jgi:putative transposase